jgi:NAD-dependent SIR2 family protein deacetylase
MREDCTKMKSTIPSGIIELLDRSSRMLVVTGAGISTGSGIPDFRSPGGLYSAAKERYDLPYPEAIFDIRYFRKNPKPFFLLSAELLNADIEPTACHRLLAAIEKAGRIEVLVTQNIDMLHRKAGSRKVVECHGSYLSGRCQTCGKRYEFGDFEKSIREGEIPRCGCGGVIKPDVVFFGEQLPQEFLRLYFRPPDTDLLLVLGTSLTVQPVAGFALKLAPALPSILINRVPGPGDDAFTYVYHGELDEFAAEAAGRLGMELT